MPGTLEASLLATVLASALALCLSLPLSVLSALYVSRLGAHRSSRLVGFLLEVAAVVPSVVYGLWATDLVRGLWGEPRQWVGWLVASAVLSVMVTPTLTLFLVKALEQTAPLTEAALALGATLSQAAWLAQVRQSRPQIVAAVLLSLSRAFGESVAVSMVLHRMGSGFNTMTSLIVRQQQDAWFLGPTVGMERPLNSSGLVLLSAGLFVVSFVFYLASQRIARPRGRR